MSENQEPRWRAGLAPSGAILKDGQFVGAVTRHELAEELVRSANRTANDLEPEHIEILRISAAYLADASTSDEAECAVKLMEIVRHVESLAAFRSAPPGAPMYVHMSERRKEDQAAVEDPLQCLHELAHCLVDGGSLDKEDGLEMYRHLQALRKELPPAGSAEALLQRRERAGMWIRAEQTSLLLDVETAARELREPMGSEAGATSRKLDDALHELDAFRARQPKEPPTVPGTFTVEGPDGRVVEQKICGPCQRGQHERCAKGWDFENGKSLSSPRFCECSTCYPVKPKLWGVRRTLGPLKDTWCTEPDGTSRIATAEHTAKAFAVMLNQSTGIGRYEAQEIPE